MANLEIPYKYPAEQARRPRPGVAISAEVFREKEAAGKDGREADRKADEGARS